MKKIIAIICSAMLFIQTAYAEEDITVRLNGVFLTFDRPPMIYNDRTMVPVRAIFEALGLSVQWFEEEQRITAFNENINMTMFIGDCAIYLNGKTYNSDTAPMIADNRTLVPLRAIGELLGADVEWDGENKRVTIDTANSEYFTGSAQVSDRDLEKKVLELTNIERAKWGLKPLVWNDDLAKTALEHSEDMANRDFFSHENPDGESPFDRIKAAGIDYIAAAENIAAGQATPEAAMQSWMNSKGHRDNIMNPKLEELGVGIAKGGKYGIYWTQNFATLKN